MKFAFDVVKFNNEIDKMCRNNVDYIDAVITWCERNNVDVEVLAGVIKKDPVIKSKLQADAENLNFLKGGAKLPI
jgi:Phage late-transcription coactivator